MVVSVVSSIKCLGHQKTISKNKQTTNNNQQKIKNKQPTNNNQQKQQQQRQQQQQQEPTTLNKPMLWMLLVGTAVGYRLYSYVYF